MKARICDRCGECYKEKNTDQICESISIPVNSDFLKAKGEKCCRDKVHMILEFFDLCENCKKELFKYVADYLLEKLVNV